ncbi:hypothetical protein GGR52DRAFT_568880 [Hypoxylon sp. FL1284]|nr:hypothetical protein GGR52DRAFT_568880 [Hypoxylon sp. FL1284]
MKFQLSALFLGLAATAVSAQNVTTTGPFFLHFTGKDGSTLDGYATSCHAGAAIEAVCYGAGGVPEATNYTQYFFNYTGYNSVGDSQAGQVFWNLPYVGENGQALEEQVMNLQYIVNSNVAGAMFGLGVQTLFGFDADGRMFGYNYYDDTTFTAGTNPAPNGEASAYYQWYVCWQYFTGYYYQSLAWATSTPPHNPTCEPVDVFQVFPA